MNRKRAVEANSLGVLAEEARTNGVERSRPSDCIRHYPGAFAHDVCHDAFYAPRHLCGSAS
jgi:hypothetical protein